MPGVSPEPSQICPNIPGPPKELNIGTAITCMNFEKHTALHKLITESRSLFKRPGAHVLYEETLNLMLSLMSTSGRDQVQSGLVFSINHDMRPQN